MGQKSAVDRLPEKLRKRLTSMLANPACTQAEIADAINAEAGEQLISTSSVNRYSQKMKRFAEKSRQAQEIADAYIDKYGSDDRQKLGKVVNEQIRVAIFDLMGEFDEIREDPDFKATEAADMLCKISRGLKELEQAEKLNAERTDAIRRATLAEAADAVEQVAQAAGISAEIVAKIKTDILGLK